MTSPNLLAGNRFRVLRSAGGSPETFTFVCIAQTKSLTQTNQYEDATVPDCDNPTAIPNRKSVVRSHEWGLSISGSVDPVRLKVLQTDVSSETPHRYQFLIDEPLAAGGGTYTGAVFFESLTVTSTNGGIVNFTATARGDDALVWADAAV